MNVCILSRGLRGLAIRLARAINRALRVKGRVWSDRYHARALTTPRAVRNAIVYVLMNARKHGLRVHSGVDVFSSAPWFDGFSERFEPPDVPCPVYASKTWLGLRFDERLRAPD